MSIFNSTSSSSANGAVTKSYIDNLHLASQSYVNSQVATIKAMVDPIKADLDKATATTAGSVQGTLVRRDANKDFECSKLKLYHIESAASVLNIAGDNQTQTLNIGSGTNVQTINMGSNGSGATTINLGGGSDQVKVNLPLKNSTGANFLNASSNGNITLGLGISGDGGGNTLIGNNVSGVMSAAGVWNTAVGAQAMSAITTGTRNVALGHNTLSGLTTGENNIGIGLRAGFETSDATKTLTSGSRNVLIGSDTRTATSTMANSTAIGYGAIVDADNTIQLGNTAVTAVKTSGVLTAAGLESVGTTLNIASNNNTNTVNIGSGTGVQTINMGNNGTGATSINVGGGSDLVQLSRTNCSSLFSLGQQTEKAKILALWNSNSLDPNNQDDHRFYGFGITDGGKSVPVESGVGWTRYQVPAGMQHRFYSALTNTTSAERFRIAADGKVSLGAGGSLEAVSGDLNVGSSTAVVNIAAGATAQTINIGTGAGTKTINMGGLKLPTAGGTASTLDFYESITFSSPQYTPFGSPSQMNFFITRVGNVVTLQLCSSLLGQATEAGTFSTTTPLPARFRPVNYGALSLVPIYNNSFADLSTGIVTVSTDGYIRIETMNQSNQGKFSATGMVGYRGFNISYVIRSEIFG